MNYSAVITFFNSPNPVQAIQSALAQTIKPQEIIVVDDCSNIEFQSLLRDAALKYECTYVSTPINMGPAGARNLGIKEASNNVIVFFDDDDVSLPERAFAHIESFKSGSQLSYVSSKKIYPNGHSFEAINQTHTGQINSSEFAQYLLAGIRGRDFPKVYIPTCCLAYLRDSFDTHEPFDSHFRRLEDVDFALRASERGLIFSFSNTIGVVRNASEGVDKNSLIESSAQLEILFKFMTYFEQRKFKKIQMWYQIRAYYFSRSYLKLIKTAMIFILKFGMNTRKIRNGLSRLVHDVKRNLKVI